MSDWKRIEAQYDYEQEQRDPRRTAKGMFYATLLSAPVWCLIIATISYILSR